jgi:hypothetical protein
MVVSRNQMEREQVEIWQRNTRNQRLEQSSNQPNRSRGWREGRVGILQVQEWGEASILQQEH